MPAVQDIIATINQFALARLSLVGGWWSREASRSLTTGQQSSPLRREWWDQAESEYARAGPEPLLDDILADPVVQLIMRADRVQAADLHSLRDAMQHQPAMSAERPAA